MATNESSIKLTVSNGIVAMEIKNFSREEAASVLWMGIESLVNGCDHTEEVQEVLKTIGGYRDI